MHLPLSKAYLLIGGSLFASIAMLSAPAAAQTESAPQDQSGFRSPDDIVVTAQRREERLQDVPISVSVATAQSLKEANISSLEELGQATPGLTISKATTAYSINVRGVGSGTNIGFEQSVAVFLDGIHHGRSRTIRSDFFDVDRIEVLKGPQTTFFGANAIAGAVNITSKKPEDSFEANASALFSPNYGEYDVQAGVSLPITPDLAVRIAGRLSGMDGYIDMPRLNMKGPNLNDKQGRISVLWTPSDKLTVEARYDISRSRGTGQYVLELTNCPPPPGLPTVGQCARNLGLVTNLDGQLNYSADIQGPNPAGTYSDEVALTARYDLGEVTFVSTTGYYKQNFFFYSDSSAPYPAPGPLGSDYYFRSTSLDTTDQFSQELRLH